VTALRHRRWTLLLAVTGLSSLVALTAPALADACGSFFRARAVDPEQTPSLSREKVLLIHDAKLRRQHFIREVAFTRAHEPFGFVVPTPTRPEIGEVANTPFTELRTRFPFAPAPRSDSKSSGGGGRQASSAGVEVLEVAQVGSFTAFVLAADDADALGRWLADNHLVSNPASDAWLAHYVELGFFYVAMRYDPPDSPGPDLSGSVIAETIRISFASPLPYYPYLEPTRPELEAEGKPRLLELWYVGSEPVVPVATRERDGVSAWVQPLQRGRSDRDARDALVRTLDPELSVLLPSGPLLVQTFQDQKRSREGFGDVLFAFSEPVARTPEFEAELEPLLGLLDPALIEPAASEDRP
jgi:hypothetical protein